MTESNSEPYSQCDASSYFAIQPPEVAIQSQNYPWIHRPIPKIDSRLILVGSSGCGKTNVVRNLLSRYWIDPDTN